MTVRFSRSGVEYADDQRARGRAFLFPDPATDRRYLRRGMPSPLRKTDRNREILARWRDGATMGDLAREYRLSRSRISQILAATQRDEVRAS